MRIPIIIALSLGIGSLPCFSQEEQVELQFVTFPKLITPEPVELLVGKEKTIQIELPTNCLSKVYKVDRLSQLELGKSAIGEDEKFIFKTYGRATLLPAKKQIILVLRKGVNISDGLEMIVMDNQQDGFSGGKYFFMNAAKVEIAVVIGDQKFAIKPRKHTLLKPKPSKVKGERKYLFTYLAFRKQDKLIPFYDSTWRYSERARCMVFIYHDPHTKQLRTHTIRDYIE